MLVYLELMRLESMVGRVLSQVTFRITDGGTIMRISRGRKCLSSATAIRKPQICAGKEGIKICLSRFIGTCL